MRFLPAMTLSLALLVVLSCLLSCGPRRTRFIDPRGGPEAFALTGEALYRVPIRDEAVRTRHEENLAAAERDYTADPHSEIAIIWLGRRTAYLGRYQEAIEIYTEGLRIHPFSVRLLRHRGHRYITTRQLDAAVHDLTRAAKIMAREADAVEPDGLPNHLNQPTGTTHSSVWYHLGLAHYLRGEFEDAERAWGSCADISRNDDMLVASLYWQYLARRRLGRATEAAALLERVGPEMNIIENASYHQLLRLFKGEQTPEGVRAASGAAPGVSGAAIDDATVGYGIGAWRLVNGHRDDAFAIFERVRKGESWAAFGYLAAEAEFTR